jgi:hypothetical protein
MKIGRIFALERGEADAPKSRGANAEAARADMIFQQKAFQRKASSEHALESVIWDGDGIQGELLEVWKIQRPRRQV